MAGGSKKLLWFFSRSPEMGQDVFIKLKGIAKSYGFDTDTLIYPQDKVARNV
ncbi:MAG: lipocalin family protein [Candidatus Marinimicrobia bacterium]|nr:lipocalin family protein [Candidatus Neomarinimicrobiota bacterium]